MKIFNVRMTKLASGSGLIVTLFCALLLLGMSMVQPAESAGVGVLTDTKVNPNGAPTEFIGGIGDPGYYPDPRYLGKYELFTVTDGSITHRNKHVDYGHLYYDATFIAKFDKPPALMTTGETVTLNATTEGSGFVSENAWWGMAGIKFQYDSDDLNLPEDEIAATNLDFISDTTTVNFNVPVVTAGGRIEISAGLRNCPACWVQYIYEPGTVEEGFVLTNTSTCEGAANDVAVPPGIGFCAVTVNDVPVPQNSITQVEMSDIIKMGENSSAAIRKKCLQTYLRTALHMFFEDPKSLNMDVSEWRNLKKGFFVAIMYMYREGDICNPHNSKSYATGSSTHISLGLQSGVGRVKPALDNLVLDIETDTAKVSSVAKNDFTVGYNPDTDLTIAACHRGSVTVNPANPNLSSVTLKTGKMVKVWSDRIGPITNIGQINSAPILLLLDDGAK